MGTRALLRLAATGEADEQSRARAELKANDSHYPAVLQSLAEAEDARVTFWALELLVKHFPLLLQRDANQAIPLLLACLTRGNGPVCDRAAWALSIIGKPAVEALLVAIGAAPDASDAAVYIGAIRGNTSVHLLAEQVLKLLDKQLGSSNEHVRYWALVVLMDIGPLRPSFDTRLPIGAFEALYGKLLTVAQEFSAGRHDTMASWYEGLLTQHLAAGSNYRSRP